MEPMVRMKFILRVTAWRIDGFNSPRLNIVLLPPWLSAAPCRLPPGRALLPSYVYATYSHLHTILTERGTT